MIWGATDPHLTVPQVAACCFMSWQGPQLTSGSPQSCWDNSANNTTHMQQRRGHKQEPCSHSYHLSLSNNKYQNSSHGDTKTPAQARKQMVGLIDLEFTLTLVSSFLRLGVGGHMGSLLDQVSFSHCAVHPVCIHQQSAALPSVLPHCFLHFTLSSDKYNQNGGIGDSKKWHNQCRKKGGNLFVAITIMVIIVHLNAMDL